MKNLFVPYEIALKLKEKGFDEVCFAKIYDNGVIEMWSDKVVTAKVSINSKWAVLCLPTHQQVNDWLRETKHIHLTINSTNFTIAGGNFETIKSAHFEFKNYYDSYNKAIEEALKLI